MNGFRAMPIAAAQDQLPVGACGGFELVEGRNEPDMVFSRVFQSCNVKEERGGQFVPGQNPRAGFPGGAGKKAFMLQAIMDDGDALRWQSEKLLNVVRGVVADGDDTILPPGDAAGPKATPPEAAATQSLVDAFARSEISGQAYDIASSDRHTVKPWLAARTALGSEVIDLSDAGFPLAGGRLDIIDGAPVATLVYRHKEHWIDVTELPLGAASVASAENVATVKGFHIRRWSDGLRAYVAVSDIDDGELADFVIAFRKRVEAARASKEP